MASKYILRVDRPGYYTFQMPRNFENQVEVHLWGAGGGNGSGARGAGGGYAFSNVSIATGSFVELVVGGRGGNNPTTHRGGAAGTGLNQGVGPQVKTALVVVDPRNGSSDNGWYTRTAAAQTGGFTSVRQYIVRLNGVTVWDSANTPPSIYQPRTYRGSIYGIPGPGPGDYLNAFDLEANIVSTLFAGGRGADQGDPEDGDAGGAGGGGGASAIIVSLPFGGDASYSNVAAFSTNYDVLIKTNTSVGLPAAPSGDTDLATFGFASNGVVVQTDDGTNYARTLTFTEKLILSDARDLTFYISKAGSGSGSFRYDPPEQGNQDYMRLEYSLDGSTGWTTLSVTQPNQLDNPGQWYPVTVKLPSAAKIDSGVYVRFRNTGRLDPDRSNRDVYAVSRLFKDGDPSVVGAGGGGGGGLGEDYSGGATAGNPGGVYPGYTSGTYYPVSDHRWGGFINTYGIWYAPTGGTHNFSVTLNFPSTGTYTFISSSDNNSVWGLDGSYPYSTPFTAFGSSYTQSVSVSSGNHIVNAQVYNPGDVGGWAMRILKPDGTELWNSRNLRYSEGLTNDTNGANGNRGGSGGGGGGGGGYRGGSGGISYGDDQRGGTGGNGGMNYGYITQAGSGTLAGGRTTTYYTGAYGNQGYDGYAVLVFTRKFNLYYKQDDGNIRISFDANVTANVGDAFVQTTTNAIFEVTQDQFSNVSEITGNTIVGKYFDANVFTLGTGNIEYYSGNSNVAVVLSQIPITSTGNGIWIDVDDVYWKDNRSGSKTLGQWVRVSDMYYKDGTWKNLGGNASITLSKLA